MSLFRAEVIEAQRRRLYGEATLHRPVAFSLFTGVIVGLTVVVTVFLSVASFARKETVQGAIIPEAGLAEVVSARAGTVTQVSVEVGQVVERGAPLAALSGDPTTSKGGLAELQKTQTRMRVAELDLQLASQRSKSESERQCLTSRAMAGLADVARLRQVLVYQQEQLRLAEQQLANITPLVVKGFVSGIERDRRAQLVLAQKQATEDLARQIEARQADAHDLRAQAEEIPSQQASEASQLRSAKSVLEQGLDELHVQGHAVIRAPVAGRITAVNVRAGSPVTDTAALFAIAPRASPLQAEIFIPTRAAGFVAEGQSVRLMVDSFSYQRFGMLAGVVTRIHRSPVTLPPEGPGQTGRSAYRALVRINQPFVMAYGVKQPLQPGMIINADIVTSRQTILQMLLDPIISARRRLQ